jgi:hypothetical protein
MEVSGQRHITTALYPRERTPGMHWIGGLEVSELVWTQRLVEKSFACTGNPALVVQSVIRHYTD